MEKISLQKVFSEKRKKYIWGTGRRAKQLSIQLDVANTNIYGIEGYIESEAKTHMFEGLPIYSIEEFNEWENCFVIVGVNNGYSEIFDVLSFKGLKRNIDYIHWQEIDVKYVLGISCYGKEATAALVRNGEVVCAYKEEQFTGVQCDYHFPKNAILNCISEAGVHVLDIDAVVYNESPIRIMETLVNKLDAVDEAYTKKVNDKLKIMLTEGIWIDRVIYDFFEKNIDKNKIFAYERFYSYSASIFYKTPYTNAAILTIIGDEVSTTVTIGRGNENMVTIAKIAHLNIPIDRMKEKNILWLSNYAMKIIGEKNLCLVGDLEFLDNIKEKIKQQIKYEDVWLISNIDEINSAVGAALYYYYDKLDYINICNYVEC